MSDPGQDFRQRLLAIFADEAREHLRQIEEGLLAMEGSAPAERGASAGPVLKALHTLKGAARAVDLDHLERLCHAMEGACAALAAVPAGEGGADLDRLHQAVGLARELAGGAGGRARNQATVLGHALDEASARLRQAYEPAAAPGGPAPGLPPDTPPDPPPAPGPAAGSDTEAEAAAPALPAGVVRVRPGQLDAIRTETEGLLGCELELMHRVEELKTLAQELAAEAPEAGLRCEQLAQRIAGACHSLSSTRTRLMGAVLETSLEPFGGALGELPALVRKLARGRGREVVLQFEGGDILVDRRVLGALREVLFHLVTNAVDHGIEPPEQRRAAGKEPAGRVEVSARLLEGRQILVRVADDGAGIDTEALARAAGVAAELDRMDERERLGLALRAGVSTQAEVTTVSGRGVGLAVVADKVAAVGGSLAIASAPGQGCSFELRLPVSLASLRALVVEAGARRYALPLAALECVRALAPGSVGTVENRETVVVDQRVLPLVRLAALCGAPLAETAQAGGRRFALLVDAIVAEQDVLPRSLGPLLRRVRYFSGATQLGDGSLVPLLSLEDVAAHTPGANGLAAPLPGSGAGAGEAARRVLVVEDSITSRLLLKHILEGAGYLVETAADGLEALSRLRHGRFDAVVSDVEMPQLDGIALTSAIRADPRSAELPVILVTTLQSPAERERGLHAGADAYLTKGSFDQDQLLAALRRLT